jgi:small subunit ribosomal protein S4e
MLQMVVINIAYQWPDVRLASSIAAQAPKPSAGPHKQRECLPLLLILRNRLK